MNTRWRAGFAWALFHRVESRRFVARLCRLPVVPRMGDIDKDYELLPPSRFVVVAAHLRRGAALCRLYAPASGFSDDCLVISGFDKSVLPDGRSVDHELLCWLCCCARRPQAQAAILMTTGRA